MIADRWGLADFLERSGLSFEAEDTVTPLRDQVAAFSVGAQKGGIPVGYGHSGPCLDVRWHQVTTKAAIEAAVAASRIGHCYDAHVSVLTFADVVLVSEPNWTKALESHRVYRVMKATEPEDWLRTTKDWVETATGGTHLPETDNGFSAEVPTLTLFSLLEDLAISSPAIPRGSGILHFLAERGDANFIDEEEPLVKYCPENRLPFPVTDPRNQALLEFIYARGRPRGFNWRYKGSGYRNVIESYAKATTGLAVFVRNLGDDVDGEDAVAARRRLSAWLRENGADEDLRRNIWTKGKRVALGSPLPAMWRDFRSTSWLYGVVARMLIVDFFRAKPKQVPTITLLARER